MKSIKDKILSETPESVIQKVRETTNELVESKQRLEKYSERFDNKENEIVQGVFNPENWGRRLVKQEVQLKNPATCKHYKEPGCVKAICECYTLVPKQETLEEVAEGFIKKQNFTSLEIDDKIFEAILFGAKWQQEQDKNKFSEEKIIDLIQFLSMNEDFNGYSSVSKETAKYFLEQFKKK